MINTTKLLTSFDLLTDPNAFILGVTFGVVVAQVVSLEEFLGTEAHWHYALSFYIILVIVCFLPYAWLPESPKYLYIVAGKRDEARKGEKCFYYVLLIKITVELRELKSGLH